jgi:hypothetical protein
MNHTKLDEWTAAEISNLAPYLADNANDITQQLLTQNPDQASEFLIGLLGSEMPVLEFIEKYNAKRFGILNKERWAPIIESKAAGEMPAQEVQSKQSPKKPKQKGKQKKLTVVGSADPTISDFPLCECMGTPI